VTNPTDQSDAHRTSDAADASVASARPVAVDPRRAIDRDRLRGRATRIALIVAAIGAVGQALGTLVIGRLAERPDVEGVRLLAGCLVGAAILDTGGRVAWNNAVDRAEGALRSDLLDAVMHQPLSALSEQAVGEMLDRIDDDTHEIGSLLRLQAWRVVRLAFLTGPLVLIAGLTWWPAWLLFPIVAGAVFAAIRPQMNRLAHLRELEEAAWSDHAAATEEGIAARDDLRTSLGQPHAVRRCAELAAVIHERLQAVVVVEASIVRRAGLLLHGLLATVAATGVLVVASGGRSTSTLVTLFAVTVTFVGQIDQVARHLPDLQAGVGALLRLRALMAVEAEPSGGLPVPPGPLSIELRDLNFAYDHGTFALDGVSLTIDAGTTCALVGRSGSGKSTLAALLSRATEPAPGTVLLGGVDVTTLDLDALRSTIGVVTQRTEILAGTLAQNIALFADIAPSRIADAVEELGLDAWVAGLPEGLDTLLGPAGLTLSAGEEQLVAFARLLIRDVSVIVLDEATARMDPVTEQQVVAASQRLLAGRTGVLIAHRLATTERADHVAVLDSGRLVESGSREELAARDGAFRRLLEHADDRVGATLVGAGVGSRVANSAVSTGQVGGARRQGAVPAMPEMPTPPSLARGTWNAIRIHPNWGLAGAVAFLVASLLGAYGAVTGWIWGNLVVRLENGQAASELLGLLVVGLLAAPALLAFATLRYPHWWVAVMLRVRTTVLVGQTDQRRLHRTPPGEVVARAMDSDRYTRYADRWVDFVNGLIIAIVAAFLGGTLLAGGVLLAVMALTAVASATGSPSAGRSAAASSTARAEFGRSLVSALDSIRTVKLSAATKAVHEHVRSVDAGRVDAAVREHRVQSVLDGVPVVLVQSGVVAAWAIHVAGGWGLSTALLVSGAVAGFEWFGRVSGSIITEAPGTRAWQQETSTLAGGRDLVDLPDGVDLIRGIGPAVVVGEVDRLDRLELHDVGVFHDDGTVGVEHVDLVVERGELVLLLGRVGSGKSSLLAALAGLVSTTGSLSWNGRPIVDAETFLRPGRVAYVGQVPRVLSGSFSDNVRLGHARELSAPIEHARLDRDIADAGGIEALVGHRGVRLSGGQVQRLALARALATGAELLVADDVSSALDATTEVELWDTMRASGRTVIGATSKRSALARADRVVVIVDGHVAAQGPWDDVRADWDHLAA
jgi:ABC-type multidrug transport system fused ATPase/permease subunit